jgi:hypothetical protein
MITAERVKSLIQHVANSDMDYKDKEDIAYELKMDLKAIETYEEVKELMMKGIIKS